MMKRVRRMVALLVLTLAWLCPPALCAQSPKPCLVMDFPEKDLDKALELCRQGGFEYLLHRYPFSTYGHYKWNPDFASQGDASVSAMVQRAAEEGVRLGIYIQEDAISINDEFFAPKYYKLLRREGEVPLFDAISVTQPDLSVYKCKALSVPSSLNLLMVDDEIISYGTMEPAGDLMLLHQCNRGAYGTKVAAHPRSTMAYKLADAPERFVYPDGELIDLVRQQLDARIDAAGITFMEYASTSGHEMLNEAQRVQNVERWSKECEGSDGQPMTLGWFPIHGADRHQQCTTLEDVEWMLSKSAAFNANYGLVVPRVAMHRYGQLGEVMSLARTWNELCSSGLLSDELREEMRDPYQDWHLEREEEGFLLYRLFVSRRFRCAFSPADNGLYVAGPWDWSIEEEGPFGLRVFIEGKGEIQNPVVHLGDEELLFPCSVKANQILYYDFDTVAYITDLEYNVLEVVTPIGDALLPSGDSQVRFSCTFAEEKLKPAVSVRYLTRETPIRLGSATADEDQFSPRTLILMYDVTVGKEPLKKAFADYGAEVIYEYSIINGFAIRIPEGKDIHEAMEHFKKVEGCLSVEPDRIHHLDVNPN